MKNTCGFLSHDIMICLALSRLLNHAHSNELIQSNINAIINIESSISITSSHVVTKLKDFRITDYMETKFGTIYDANKYTFLYLWCKYFPPEPKT